MLGLRAGQLDWSKFNLFRLCEAEWSRNVLPFLTTLDLFFLISQSHFHCTVALSVALYHWDSKPIRLQSSVQSPVLLPPHFLKEKHLLAHHCHLKRQACNKMFFMGLNCSLLRIRISYNVKSENFKDEPHILGLRTGKDSIADSTFNNRT